MISLSKVSFPPVKVKLHWATWYCSQCLCEEIETVSKEMYMCGACKHIDSGKTIYVETKVIEL